MKSLKDRLETLEADAVKYVDCEFNAPKFREGMIQQLKDILSLLQSDVERDNQQFLDVVEDGDVSEFLYGEDDRGDIFEAGRLLGRLEKTRDVLGIKKEAST